VDAFSIAVLCSASGALVSKIVGTRQEALAYIRGGLRDINRTRPARLQTVMIMSSSMTGYDAGDLAAVVGPG